MKGLIIKDLLLLKRQRSHIIFYVMLLFYVFYTLFLTEENSMIIVMSMLLCSMLTITTISYDDFAKWEKYALAMPISRKDIVKSKYILLGITVLGGTGIGLFVSLILDLIRNKSRVPENLLIAGVVSAIGICAISIMIPLIFKFGVEKSRLMLMGVVAIPSILVLSCYKMIQYFNIPKPSQATLDLFIKSLAFFIPVLIFFIVLITYKISIRIFTKKDF